MLEKRHEKIYFGLICFIGAILLFVKFGNSGAVGTTHLQQLGVYTNMDVSAYEGYLSTVFSVFQSLGWLLDGHGVEPTSWQGREICHLHVGGQAVLGRQPTQTTPWVQVSYSN